MISVGLHCMLPMIGMCAIFSRKHAAGFETASGYAHVHWCYRPEMVFAKIQGYVAYLNHEAPTSQMLKAVLKLS